MRGVPVNALLLLLLAACGGGEPGAPPAKEAMQAAARIAERNLVKIRDCVLAYHRKNGAAPVSMDDLEPFGISESRLEACDDYSALGYSFYSVEFGKDGALTQGWFMASPIEGRKAYRVRMNGVTGEFDYAASDERIGPAPAANAAKTR